MKNYIEETRKTRRKFTKEDIAKLTSDDMDLIHAGLGLPGEVGEMIDALKKYLMYGQELDRKNVAEEAGDICWFLAIILDEIGVDFEAIMKANIAKLQARYKSGKFSKKEALNRDTAAEMDQIKV